MAWFLSVKQNGLDAKQVTILLKPGIIFPRSFPFYFPNAKVRTAMVAFSWSLFSWSTLFFTPPFKIKVIGIFFPWLYCDVFILIYFSILIYFLYGRIIDTCIHLNIPPTLRKNYWSTVYLHHTHPSPHPINEDLSFISDWLKTRGRKPNWGNSISSSGVFVHVISIYNYRIFERMIPFLTKPT